MKIDNPPKVPRLYHFDQKTVENIEFLATVFGGKEKGVAAAVQIAAAVLKGESAELRIGMR